MAKNIDPELRKIGEYLKLKNDTTFIIPQYQRPYSWGIDQCDTLWQDINDYIEKGSEDPYFFGTVIINCKDNDRQLELIDGQQRTTTFLLLLKALLIRINIAILKTKRDIDSAQLYRGLKARRTDLMKILYKIDVEEISEEPSEKDNEIYSKVNILITKSVNEQELYRDELNNILKAIDYQEAERNTYKIPYKQKDNKYTNFFRNFKHFYDKATELSEPELNNFTKQFIESCEVIEIKSWQVEQAISMFNSLNSSGLPLYDSDIISAKLYEKAASKNITEKYENLWKELTEQIQTLEKLNISNMDSILMQQMYYERAKEKEYVSNTGAINVTTPGLRRYFVDINKNLLENPIELCKGMLNLAKIWETISSYPIVQILLKFNENSKLFLGSYFYRFNNDDITEAKIKTVLECMLRLFVILEIVETGYSSSQFKSFLFKEELKFVDSNITEQEIKIDFDKHIKDKWYKTDIKEYIKEYNGNSLVYLNEYLFTKEMNENKDEKDKVHFKLGENYDIEHIMPQSGKNLYLIRKDANINSEDEFNALVNKLGNKIILESKINRRIGNEWFRTKITTNIDEDRTGYINSNYPIAKKLVETYNNDLKPYWTKEDILKATDKVSERIVKFIFGEE